MVIRSRAWVLALASLVGAAQVSVARDIEVTLRAEGATLPRTVAMGQGPNLPQLTYRQADGTYSRTLSLDHLEPQIYELVLTYSNQSFVLPVRLHRNSPPINLPVYFDGPPLCREKLVQEAERPAQIGNIPQALRRYLLAAHLSEIDDESARCRDSQPERLRKARIDRGIQLATFRGSPFMPPENDESEWAEILGESEALAYAGQVQQAEAILLSVARQQALEDGDYQAAAEVNGLLIARSTVDEATGELYRSIGLTQQRLEDDQAFIEARAAAIQTRVEASEVNRTPG